MNGCAQLIGLLDTGADITAIPATLKDRYKLYPIGRLQLEGIDGITSTVYTYEANITALDQPARTMEGFCNSIAHQFEVQHSDQAGLLYSTVAGSNERRFDHRILPKITKRFQAIRSIIEHVKMTLNREGLQANLVFEQVNR